MASETVGDSLYINSIRSLSMPLPPPVHATEPTCEASRRLWTSG